MSLDMYGEKVASASELIRQVSGKDYFDAFGINTENTLELFISCMDQVCQIEREAQAARIAYLELKLIDTQAECIKRGADLFEARLAAAPSVKQLISIDEMCKILDAALIKSTERTDYTILYTVTFDQLRNLYMKGMHAAPQTADTDKVREAISDEQIMRIAGDVRQRNAGAWPGDVAFVRAVLASMAPQAPVREVPGWISVKDQMPEDRIRVLGASNLGYVREVFYGTQSDCSGDMTKCWRENDHSFAEPEVNSEVTHWMPLPAAPIQQEGDRG